MITKELNAQCLGQLMANAVGRGRVLPCDELAVHDNLLSKRSIGRLGVLSTTVLVQPSLERKVHVVGVSEHLFTSIIKARDPAPLYDVLAIGRLGVDQGGRAVADG